MRPHPVVFDPVYKGVLHILVNVDDPTFDQEIRLATYPHPYEPDSRISGVQGRFTSVDTPRGWYYFIMVRKFKPSSPGSWSTLYHELFHYISELMRHRGIPLTYETEECWAYIMSFYWDEITAVLSKKPKRQKRK